jgi:hypothetical protein
MSEKSVDLPAPFGPTRPMRIAAIHLERDILEEDAPGERFTDLRNGEHGERRDSHVSAGSAQVARASSLRRSLPRKLEAVPSRNI